jgi:uracil-DNA glycosylase
MAISQMHPIWRNLLSEQLPKLEEILEAVALDPEAIPERSKILRVLELPPQDYRVLILGQDPYPNPDHAVGLAFAVPEGTRPFPPTLANIFKELRADLGEGTVQEGDISGWSKRGVLLLNRHLTTRSGNSAAHLELGWAEITSAVVEAMYEIHGDDLVSILWGQKALEVKSLLGKSTIIYSAHPSPLSSYRGFFGSKPFSACNQALKNSGLSPIDWSC